MGLGDPKNFSCKLFKEGKHPAILMRVGAVVVMLLEVGCTMKTYQYDGRGSQEQCAVSNTIPNTILDIYFHISYDLRPATRFSKNLQD